MNLTATFTANDRPPRAHDLLWVADGAAIEAAEPLPVWATGDWLRRAPLVVRREDTGAGRIPVGLRGLTRSQRLKAYVAQEAVQRCVSPEDLATAQGWHDWTASGEPAALGALAMLAPVLDAAGLTWGPTGGVGFALASGLRVLRADSDLDLVVRAPAPLSVQQRHRLAMLASCVACRLDIQIDTGRGAFAFAEWLSGRRHILLKTEAGPMLTDNPWGVGNAPMEDVAPAR